MNGTTAFLAPPQAGAQVLGLWMALIGIGCVVVASASMDLSLLERGHPLALWQRHLTYVGLAAAAMLAALSLPIWLHRACWPLYALAIVAMLAAVLHPAIGTAANGSRRWIVLPGFTLQPSEFARPVALIVAAGALTALRRGEALTDRRTVLLFVWIGLVGALLIAEPDFGGAVILFGAAAVMAFLAGARLRWFVLIMLAGAALAIGLVRGEDYRWQRVMAYLNPWDFASDESYQLIQAMVAIGRGEWFGVGIGGGLQKLFYLPEAHTDFIVAVLVEETGIAGFVLLLGLLLLLSARLFTIGRLAEAGQQGFAALLAYGFAALLAIQSLVSLGVNVGFLPTKGLTTPFVSFGGNSLIALSAMLGLALRIHHEACVALQPAPAGPARGRSRRSRRDAAAEFGDVLAEQPA